MALNPSTKIRQLKEAGLAREFDVSRQAIHELVKRNILMKDKNGLIDVDMAKVALAARVHPSSKTSKALNKPEEKEITSPTAINLNSEKTNDLETTSYHVAKTLREAAEAQIARLKLAEMQGDLIRVDAVKSTLASVFSTTRDNLLQIPSRLSAILAAETDAAKVHELLQAELHRAIEGMAAVQNSNRLAGREQAA